MREIPISQITVSGLNTRKDLGAGTEDSSLYDLAASIREHGLLNPIRVRPMADGRFELLAGQRRFLACGTLGMQTIPAVVSEVEDDEAIQVSLIENVHRADLHPLDKARAFQQLMEFHEGDLNKVSKETGVGSGTIRKYLAIITLPDTIKRDLSTRGGPAKIETLYQLRRTFDDAEDMQEAYTEIEGFSQDIQVQIIKESQGEVERIPELVAQAQEGAFRTEVCRGLRDKFMCKFIPDELADHVIQIVDAYEVSEWRPRLLALLNQVGDF